MHKAYLGIGGNIGDREAIMREAIALLDANSHIAVKKVSSFYETEPVGYTNQAWFLNSVLEVETSFSPMELLAYCNGIEQQLKRERVIRWGPRTIDIDILLYDALSIDEPNLTIPHPRMTQRAFVIVPLFEIAPELIIQDSAIKEILEILGDSEVRKLCDF